MRVAALYDIHGNLPALEAVLAEVRAANVDAIVVGGDVTPGPMVSECLAMLAALDLPVHYLRGNCELDILQIIAGHEPATLPEQHRAAVRWVAQQLTAEQKHWIAEWPRVVRLTISGSGEVLFCHATPRDEREIFTTLTPEERLLPIFSDLGADLVVCGHTHMQFDRRIGSTRVVNSGSIGMPFGAPGADWLLLGPEVELRHTNYDLQAAAERIRASAYPGAESFATDYLLARPTAEKMLGLFTKSQLGG